MLAVSEQTGSKRFSREYKEEIVRLVTELGKKQSEVAEDIGVSASTVRRWVNQVKAHGADSFPGKGYLRRPDAERKAFEKQIKDLREENAILKKAMAIFSRDER